MSFGALPVSTANGSVRAWKGDTGGIVKFTALPSVKPEDWIPAYVGTSGGAGVATPDFGGATYDESEPLTGSDKALGLVDFAVFPHLDREDGIPASPLAEIEAWAAVLSVPAYAIDDQTAIKVTDGAVEVVSEGHWKRFSANESRKDLVRTSAPE
jgi:dipeptidase E